MLVENANSRFGLYALFSASGALVILVGVFLAILFGISVVVEQYMLIVLALMLGGLMLLGTLFAVLSIRRQEDSRQYANTALILVIGLVTFLIIALTV